MDFVQLCRLVAAVTRCVFVVLVRNDTRADFLMVSPRVCRLSVLAFLAAALVARQASGVPLATVNLQHADAQDLTHGTSLFAYCRRWGKGHSTGHGMLHESSNLVALVALSATLQHDLVLFPLTLRRRHQLNFEKPAILGPGADRWFNYSAFVANGRSVIIYEPALSRCPRCHRKAPTFWAGRMKITECFRNMTVRAILPHGAGPWEERAVTVWNEVRPEPSGRVSLAMHGYLNARDVGCAIHDNIVHEARAIVRELLGNRPYAALHLRSGDLWRDAASEGRIVASRVAQLWSSSCAVAGVSCRDFRLYIASNAPPQAVEKLAASLVDPHEAWRIVTARTLLQHWQNISAASRHRGSGSSNGDVSLSSAAAAPRRYIARATYDLFVLESEILAQATVRMTTFAQSDNSYFHGALVPTRRREDEMGKMCHRRMSCTALHPKDTDHAELRPPCHWTLA